MKTPLLQTSGHCSNDGFLSICTHNVVKVYSDEERDRQPNLIQVNA